MEHCQLLCASMSAYSIVTADTLPLDNYYVSKAGFTEPPVTFTGGHGTPAINACLVGTAGKAVIVAFRGTLSSFTGKIVDDLPTFLDWLQDFMAKPVAMPGFPGAVHDGFIRGFTSVWASAAVEMEKQMQAIGAGAELYVTGHSKGGPLANYGAWAASQMPAGYTPTCVTFAGARAGDQRFADDYNQTIASTRYEYHDDVVPHVPPPQKLITLVRRIPFLPARLRELLDRASHWNYVSVGTLKFIDWDNAIVTPSTAADLEQLENKRERELLALAATCKFEQIGNDHSLAGGYCSNICPAGTCS